MATVVEQTFFATTNILDNESWYIDLGAFQHLTFQRDFFFHYKSILKRSIYMGDNFVQEAIGKENVILSMKVGDHEVKGVLHEVRHVPSFVKNLFLVSKAIAECIKIEFEQDGCSIKNSVGEVLAGAI